MLQCDKSIPSNVVFDVINHIYDDFVTRLFFQVS